MYMHKLAMQAQGGYCEYYWRQTDIHKPMENSHTLQQLHKKTVVRHYQLGESS